MRRTTAVSLVSILIVALAAACNRSEPTASSIPSGKTQINACTLVSQADAESILGQAVGKGRLWPTPGGGTGCSYEATGGTGGNYAALLVYVYLDGTGAFELNKKVGNSASVPVAGIGEQAYARGDEFNVLKNNIWLSLSVIGTKSSEKIRSVAARASQQF